MKEVKMIYETCLSKSLNVTVWIDRNQDKNGEYVVDSLIKDNLREIRSMVKRESRAGQIVMAASIQLFKNPRFALKAHDQWVSPYSIASAWDAIASLLLTIAAVYAASESGAAWAVLPCFGLVVITFAFVLSLPRVYVEICGLKVSFWRAL